ncbi:MAG: chromate transporter, partial [Clostridiales bacterium]|nr:chromate transporter [Clostridiales bacterium]
AGFFGALCATVGVVLPSFIIILLIAALVSGLMKFAGVQAFLGGLRPVVIGLVLATSVTMFLTVVLSLQTLPSKVHFDWRALVILGVLTVFALLFKKFRKKSASPILLILLSAGLGALLYAI